ncbi:DegT/DnrJ/EryC1/StrS family aminotransferase [Thermovenabulum sp.]|uniref:DegT/DnrJ/EryC1/StrS family aminotransferase n=1 Tax=Thermovenabulum sp. TaxID=3100335 RepID=UPI003C7EA1E8
MHISFLDLKAQYQTIKKEIKKEIEEVLESGNYILGPKEKEFEKEIAEYLGVKHAIGVANGTDALVLSLDALGIGPGDEVITTPYTFFASAEAVSRVGAKPVFADISFDDNLNIDVRQIKKKITKNTKAIIPVHIFGCPCNMDEIIQIARKYNLYIIEDACQAIGAQYKGKKAGTLGDIGCFSFFPTKNLGGYGDGGLVVTNNDEIAEKIMTLRVHGSTKKYYHSRIGYNSRLDEIQAAILKVKLKYIDKWNQKRIEKAKLYNDKLKNLPITLPKIYDENHKKHVFHLYTILTPKRDELKNYLEQKGIPTGIYYPLPLHLQEAYKDLGYKDGDMPNAEKASRQALSLPLYPELKEEEIYYITEAVKTFFERV